jgi:hypothetical protein
LTALAGLLVRLLTLLIVLLLTAAALLLPALAALLVLLIALIRHQSLLLVVRSTTFCSGETFPEPIFICDLGSLILAAKQSKVIKPRQLVPDATQWPEHYSSIVTEGRHRYLMTSEGQNLPYGLRNLSQLF